MRTKLILDVLCVVDVVVSFGDFSATQGLASAWRFNKKKKKKDSIEFFEN